jgi:AIPR protein
MNIYQTYISNQLKRVAQQFYPDLYAKDAQQACDEAFVVFSVALILDKPMEDVFENMVIAGKEDGGVDAVFIETYNNRPMIHIFQCKNTEKVKANVLEKLEDNYQQVFVEGRRDKAHSSDLIAFLDNNNYAQRFENRRIDTVLYYVFVGNKKDNDVKVPIEQVKSQKIQYWDCLDLYNEVGKHIAEDNRRPIKFTFKPENSNTSLNGGRQALVSFSISNIRSASFRMSALDLCKLLDHEKQVNETIATLYSSNIRGFLGRDNFTNSRILSTLQHQRFKYYFPFLNNGITMICDRMRLPDEMQLGYYLIETENPLIINGLQTTNVIYQEYLNGGDLHNVFVTVRLYETSDPELIDLVTDATNTQSSIGFRDKISNKPFMKRLKAFFADRKVALITKRGEAFQNFYFQNAFEYNIENDKALCSWFDYFIGRKKDDFNIYNDDEIMQMLYEAEFAPDAPLHNLLNDNFENFARQVFFVNKYAQLYSSIINYSVELLCADNLEEHRGKFKRNLLLFLLKSNEFDENKIIDTLNLVKKRIDKEEEIDGSKLLHQDFILDTYPDFYETEQPSLEELNNLYIPI